MLIRRRTLRVARSVALLLSLTVPAVLLGTCSDEGGLRRAADTDDSGEATPEEVLALAKVTLDETTGVRSSLASRRPARGAPRAHRRDQRGYPRAAPSRARSPSSVWATPSGPVVAVDGALRPAPLAPGYQAFDPAEYGAPDPGLLLDPEEGVSPLLTATRTSPRAGPCAAGADDAEILTSTPAP